MKRSQSFYRGEEFKTFLTPSGGVNSLELAIKRNRTPGGGVSMGLFEQSLKLRDILFLPGCYIK
jgi:hypothetical protein